MNTADTFISATEARNNFFGLLERVKKGPFPINITVKGIPKAVIMSREDYNAWMATVETLSDPELMEAIREGDKNFAEGKYQTWEEAKKELGLARKYVSGHVRKSRQKESKKIA